MHIPQMIVDGKRHDLHTGYRQLCLAIIHRARLDAQGRTFAATVRPQVLTRQQAQAEAVAWLASGAAEELLALAGYERTLDTESR